MKLHAPHVSVGESGDEYSQVSFDTRLAFQIARATHKNVEVTYDLDATKFGEVQRIVRIIFGSQS